MPPRTHQILLNSKELERQLLLSPILHNFYLFMALALRMPMEIQTHFAGCWIQQHEDFDLDELKISCSVFQEKKNILKTAKQRMFLLLLLLLS